MRAAPFFLGGGGIFICDATLSVFNTLRRKSCRAASSGRLGEKYMSFGSALK